MNTVTKVEAPSLTPLQRAATQLVLVADGGWARLIAALRMARAAINGNNRIGALPGFYVPERMKF